MVTEVWITNRWPLGYLLGACSSPDSQPIIRLSACSHVDPSDRGPFSLQSGLLTVRAPCLSAGGAGTARENLSSEIGRRVAKIALDLLSGRAGGPIPPQIVVSGALVCGGIDRNQQRQQPGCRISVFLSSPNNRAIRFRDRGCHSRKWRRLGAAS